MSQESSHAEGRIAGIDFGTVRIGVAVTDKGRSLASPLEQHTRGGPESDARYFRRLAEEEEITLFVVGLPVHTSGQESQKSQEARQFGSWLSEVTGVPVRYFDERYTTRHAEEALQSAALTSKKRKQRRDMLAAQFMLAAYLERGPTDGEGAEGLDE